MSSFGAALRQEGYKQIPRSLFVVPMQFARHQSVVYSILRSIYNRIMSGWVRLVQNNHDMSQDDPFLQDITKGIAELVWDSILWTQMTGICVCSVVEGWVRTLDEYQAEQLTAREFYMNKNNIDEVEMELIKKAQGIDFFDKKSNRKKAKDAEREDGVLSNFSDNNNNNGDDQMMQIEAQRGSSFFVSKAVNLEQLDVYFRTDIYNNTEYRFLQQTNDHGGYREVEVLGLYVMEYERPVVYGEVVQLNSLYNRIKQDYKLKEHNLLCHAQSSVIMSNPSLILQDQPIPKDSDASAATSIADRSSEVSTIRYNAERSGRRDPNLNPVPGVHPGLSFEVADAMRIQREGKAEELKDRPQVMLTGDVSAETQIGYLPYSKILAKQNMPIAAPYFMECMSMFETAIYRALCIPKGVQFDISPDYSKNKSSQTMGQNSSVGQGGASKESTAYDIYKDTTSFIRNFLLREIQTVMDRKMTPANERMAKRTADMWNAKKRNRGKRPIRVDPKKFKITIELPGSVNSDDVWSLYKIDKLEEGAFDRHFVSNGFNARDLKKQAGITVKEMNGIQPVATNASSSNKKARTN